MTPALPKPQKGKKFVLFRPPNSHSWHASILMPNGFKEDFNTTKSDRGKAQAVSSQRVKKLYKTLRLKTPAEVRRKKGELSPYLRKKRNAKLAAAAPPKKNGVTAWSSGFRSNGFLTSPLPPGPAPIPAAPLGKVEHSYARAFSKILELLFLNVHDDPRAFTDHVRAIALKVVQGAAFTDHVRSIVFRTIQGEAATAGSA